MQPLSSIFTTLLLVAWQREHGSFCVSAMVYFEQNVPHVNLNKRGIISGGVKHSRAGRPYNAFMGIPYAKVPERFQEPQPILESAWQGTLNATKPGQICAQAGMANNNLIFGGEKNCLNLNVYVPMNNNTGTGKKGYPVMFWVHGGGFMFGGGFGYGPQFFMDEDVIIVTINYRLGVFGFLSTGDGVIPGNNGLKDVVVALKWVQENIQAFGGNPNDVTAFGESAGGTCVHYLLLSQTTKGLFHRAISQSGTALNLWAYEPNPKKVAVELATYLNCATTASKPTGISSMEILTCLKALSTEELNKAQFAFKTSWPLNFRSFYFAPTAEPSDCVSSLTPFLTESPSSILSRKDIPMPDIPWMVGALENEGAPMFSEHVLSNSQLLKEINADWGKVAPKAFDYDKYGSNNEQNLVSENIKQFYFGGSEISNDAKRRTSFLDLYNDEFVVHGVYNSATKMASKGKVYLYQYAYEGPVSVMGITYNMTGLEKEIGHSDDLQHLFDLSALIPATANVIKPGSPDEEFSKYFVRLWTSFAIHGDPNHNLGNTAFQKWEPISKNELTDVNSLRWYRIELKPSFIQMSKAIKDRMDFWDNLWTKHFIIPSPGNKLNHHNNCKFH